MAKSIKMLHPMKRRSIAKTTIQVLPLALAIGQANAELMISEYVEGSSNNKAIELFNTSETDSVDLSQAVVELYFNGKTTVGQTITLEGELAPKATYVLANSAAADEIKDKAQLETSKLAFNGDDAVVLKLNNVVVDSIGQIGTDPGSAWNANGVTFKDNTVRRNEVTTDTDTSDDFASTDSWDGFGKNVFSDLGQFAAGGSTGGGNNGGGNNGGGNGGEEACGMEATLISTVQGNGSSTPISGDIVTIEAIVIADFQGSAGLKGFFVQEEDADNDNYMMTSEGLFIYEGSNSLADVNVGDRVRIKGKVGEFSDMTQISNLESLIVCGQDESLPSASEVNFPLSDSAAAEKYEGMSVVMPQTLSVADTYNLSRYGSLALSNGPLAIPTQAVAPGAPANTLKAQNDLNRIVLDDASNKQNPAQVIYPLGGLAASNTIRIGDTVTGLTGVMAEGFGSYRIQRNEGVAFTQSNPRTEAPVRSEGTNLRVASLNVLNYFNGDGQGGGFPTDRGADTAAELDRQQAKLVEAILAMEADVLGLVEIENDGFGENSAIAQLVTALNDAAGEDRYAFVNPGVNQVGTDAIAVGLVYRKDVVAQAGTAAILTAQNSPKDDQNQPLFNDDKNRAVLTQSFSINDGKESITVSVNHFKSKGSDCDSLGDPNANDGQGNCNQTRTRAAQALAQWLETNPTGNADSDKIIIGDLNSYAKEDPIAALEAAGYNNTIPAAQHSYVFKGEAGTLDYAMMSNSLKDQALATNVWSINADEPRALDYNTEYKSDEQVVSFYAADAYRSSDHDPVVVDLKLAQNVEPENKAPEVKISTFVFFNHVIGFARATDEDGKVVSRTWDLGDGSTKHGLFIAHRYKFSGQYTVSFTAEDDKGATSTVEKSVKISSFWFRF